MNPYQLPEALEDIIPPRPSAAGWGQRVRRRRRNRRVGTAAAAGVAAVAVLAAAVQLGGQPTLTATPSPADPSTPQPAITSLEPAECALPGEGEHNVTVELPDGQLPEGATTVWLCGNQSDSNRRHIGAAEPLTVGVDQAVAAFNSVPSERGPAWSCATSPDLEYRVVYGYPDGTRYQVVGSVGGCEGVESAGYHRPEALSYLEELRALWVQQRGADETTFEGDVPVCPERSTVMGLEVQDMSRAVVCGPVGSDPEAALQIALSDGLTEDIVAEITAEDRTEVFQPGIGRSAPSLVLLSEYGDPYTLMGTPDQYWWYPPSGGALRVWIPSRELAARMWAEIGASGQCTVPERITPDEVPVHVYDGGGGADAVAATVEHLEGAGFPVANTGESVSSSMGGIYLRASSDNRGMALVDSWLRSGSGELSRDDDIVDVVVTADFSLDVLRQGQPDISDGNFVCAGRGAATPTQTVPSTPTDPEEPDDVGGPEVPFTAHDVERAWFDDTVLGELPSSVRDSVEGAQDSYAASGIEVEDVEVVLGLAFDDLLRIRTTVHEGGGVESRWVEHHRLLGDGESEGVFDPAAEKCFEYGNDFLKGGSVPDDVPGDGIPGNPEFVALCLTGLIQAKSMPPGAGVGLILEDGERAPQAAVDAYNNLSGAGPECRSKDGAWGLVVYHYGDGTEYVLQVRDNGCGSVVAGNEHRRGGDGFLADLWDLTES